MMKTGIDFDKDGASMFSDKIVASILIKDLHVFCYRDDASMLMKFWDRC